MGLRNSFHWWLGKYSGLELYGIDNLCVEIPLAFPLFWGPVLLVTITGVRGSISQPSRSSFVLGLGKVRVVIAKAYDGP